MVGSPQQIIEKILYQHELYGHQRFMAQLDFGGVPFENVMKNIELIGNDIIPAIKSIYQNRRGVIMNIVLLSGSTVGSKTRIAMDDLKMN